MVTVQESKSSQTIKSNIIPVTVHQILQTSHTKMSACKLYVRLNKYALYITKGTVA